MTQPSKKRAKFQREDITQAGFVEVRPGVFEKPSPQAPAPPRDPEPPVSGVERSPKKKPQRKTGSKGSGKESNPSGVRYRLVVLSHRPRAIDPSNGCVKFIEDALIEAGYMPDDSVWFCEQPIFLQNIVPGKEEKTEVFLFEVKPGAEEAPGGPTLVDAT